VSVVLQVPGVLADIVIADAGLLDFQRIGEPIHPEGLATVHDLFRQSVGEAEEAEVPETGSLRGQRRDLVQALVRDRRFREHELAHGIAVSGGIRVRDHGPDVVSDDADVAIKAELGEQVVHVAGEGLLVVASCRGVAAAGSPGQAR
jgi:hypothetical protein